MSVCASDFGAQGGAAKLTLNRWSMNSMVLDFKLLRLREGGALNTAQGQLAAQQTQVNE